MRVEKRAKGSSLAGQYRASKPRRRGSESPRRIVSREGLGLKRAASQLRGASATNAASGVSSPVEALQVVDPNEYRHLEKDLPPTYARWPFASASGALCG
jgi:hypothetical protein